MKLVCGIGINDADHKVTITGLADGKLKQIWVCPYYSAWRGILLRTKEAHWLKNPAYFGCEVDEEWLRFSNFENWFKKQPNHNDWLVDRVFWSVDKDFLYPGNKKYSSKTCYLLPRYVNNALLESAGIRGDYPLGVSYHKQHNRFYSSIRIGNKSRYLGLYESIMDAHNAWQIAKITALREILIRYSSENNFNNVVCLRLLDVINSIEDDVKNGKETKTFHRMA